MKRFASHYLFLPDAGFMKQQVVEITNEGIVQRVFPLTEEVESVEWMPGVIVLLPACHSEQSEESVLLYCREQILRFVPDNNRVKEEIVATESATLKLFPVLLYPFDFTSMQPVAETRHRLLR